MKTYPATGISLTVKKYRGTQRLVVFFTRQRGKVEAVARGIGKPGSKLASLVEPLTLSKLFFATGRQLDHLTQGEVVDSFYNLRRDLRRYAHASYLVELTARTTEPGLAIPALFEALEQSLRVMDHGANPETVTWGYCLRLLDALGVGPVIEHCVVCAGALGANIGYHPAAGGLVCQECQRQVKSGQRISATAVAGLLALSDFPVVELQRLSLPATSRAEIRGVLRRHIEYHLGVSPTSERFLREIE